MIEENKLLALADKGQYKDILDFAADVDEEQVFIEPRCKLCNSALRAEAEAYCEKVKWNYAATEKWLESRGEKITDKSIKNHVEDHYRPLVKRIQVKHYANELAQYMKVKQDAVATIHACRAILFKELLEIGSEAGRLGHYDRCKTAELLAKLSTQIIACEEAERKHKEDFKPINIVAEKLQNIIQIESLNATPEVQARLSKVVDSFLEGLSEHALEK